MEAALVLTRSRQTGLLRRLISCATTENSKAAESRQPSLNQSCCVETSRRKSATCPHMIGARGPRPRPLTPPGPKPAPGSQTYRVSRPSRWTRTQTGLGACFFRPASSAQLGLRFSLLDTSRYLKIPKLLEGF